MSEAMNDPVFNAQMDKLKTQTAFKQTGLI